MGSCNFDPGRNSQSLVSLDARAHFASISIFFMRSSLYLLFAGVKAHLAPYLFLPVRIALLMALQASSLFHLASILTFLAWAHSQSLVSLDARAHFASISISFYAQ